MTKDCPFCAYVAGRGEASVFYEDNLVFGLMDISPVTSGHALVISKVHARRLADLEEATGQHMFTVAQRTAAAMRASDLGCQGINLMLADGEVAFQEVDHVHLHVIPRYKGDGFRIEARWGSRLPRAELDAAAQAIRAMWPGA